MSSVGAQGVDWTVCVQRNRTEFGSDVIMSYRFIFEFFFEYFFTLLNLSERWCDWNIFLLKIELDFKIKQVMTPNKKNGSIVGNF